MDKNKNRSAASPGALQGGGLFPSPPDDRRRVGADGRISGVLATSIFKKSRLQISFSARFVSDCFIYMTFCYMLSAA
jgi:hypothetical protein